MTIIFISLYVIPPSSEHNTFHLEGILAKYYAALAMRVGHLVMYVEKDKYMFYVMSGLGH